MSTSISASATRGNRSQARTVAVENTAGAYLEILRDRGIKYLFGNGGTDFAPMLEAFGRRAALGREAEAPVPILAPHENTAITMAHGYYLATGEPQVVMVHVTVGTGNAMNGLINASRSHVPIIFSAGRTPLTEEGRLGSRDNYIHWAQESFDQAGMLREYVKWDYELRSFDQLETVVDRALEVAMAEPRGPVYLTLPREVLAEQHRDLTLTSPGRHQRAASRFPDPQAIQEAAQLLLNARNPLIITTSVGQNPAAVQPLIDLADIAGIPVVVTPVTARFMNFPSNHPLHLGYHPDPFLEEADVILALESDVPWYPHRAKPRASATVIHLAEDPFFVRYPVRGYPCDLAIAADPAVALAQLKDEAVRLLGEMPELKPAREERRSRYAAIHRRQREEWRLEAETVHGAEPIDRRWLSHCINRVVDERTVVVNDYAMVPEQMEFTRPGSLFSVPAAGGLGWGVGVGLGLKLARPESRVIAIIGDGSYMFAVPLSAHFVGNKYSLPTLTVICNNRRWGAVKNANLGIYPEGWAQKTGHFAFTELEPSPKFEEIARACGGFGELVEKPGDLPAALERALAAVEQGQQAVLNVLCS